jgi:hypothetical protein
LEGILLLMILLVHVSSTSEQQIHLFGVLLPLRNKLEDFLFVFPDLLLVWCELGHRIMVRMNKMLSLILLQPFDFQSVLRHLLI